jgi:hypothetical protein
MISQVSGLTGHPAILPIAGLNATIAGMAAEDVIANRGLARAVAWDLASGAGWFVLSP